MTASSGSHTAILYKLVWFIKYLRWLKPSLHEVVLCKNTTLAFLWQSCTHGHERKQLLELRIRSAEIPSVPTPSAGCLFSVCVKGGQLEFCQNTEYNSIEARWDLRVNFSKKSPKLFLLWRANSLWLDSQPLPYPQRSSWYSWEKHQMPSYTWISHRENCSIWANTRIFAMLILQCMGIMCCLS